MKNSKKALAAILILLLTISLAACGSSDAAALVTINEKSITNADLDQYFPLFGLTSGIDVTTITDEAQITQMKEAALEDLVSMEVIRQYYDDLKQDVVPETKDTEFQAFMESVNADETTKKFLTDNNIDEAYLQKFFDNQYYTTAFFQEITESISNPEADAKAYYDANLPEFTAEQVKASHILVATVEEAEAILAELKGGADFAQIATEKSLDTTSATEGGDLGYFAREQMVAPFAEAAFATDIGALSEIVQSDYGFHIIKVADKRTYTQTFEEAQQMIMYNMFQDAYTSKLEEIKASMKIEFKD